MMPLYKIADEHVLLFRSFEDKDELGPDDLQQIALSEAQFAKKSVSIAAFIKNIEAERKAVTEARRNIEEREDRLIKKEEQLQAYLKTNMERMGISEISESAYFKIKIMNCPPSVEIFNIKQIPEQYLKIVTDQKIDKKKIKEDIDKGIEVPGAVLKQNTRLQIK